VRALVLGASGFIGRWVADALEASGAEVVRSVRDPDFAGAGEGEVHLVDLLRPGSAEQLVARVRPQVVFNLAGYGVDRAERDEAFAARLNGELVKELCYAIRAVRDDEWTGQHLVHAGSALEFGVVSGDLSDPWHCRPTTVYGKTKLAGSEHVVGAVQRGDLRGMTARLFTVFGAGEHEGRLLPSLLEAAAGDGDLPLTAGQQRRDFTWVGDVAEGLLRLGVRTEILPEGALNLATGALLTVREFVDRAAPILGIRPDRLKFGALPTRPEEMAHDPVSVERLRGLTGWTPTTSIAEAVRRTAESQTR
jgi:nucleoside-diphosphate-sugar epimerase